MYVILALLLLGVLIMAHEAGHFFAARACGIEVQEFARGMGPLLLQKRSKKGTQFSLRLLPIGGYCQFYGEDEEINDPRSFNNQAVWKRLVTVVSGPMMNFIVALLVVMIYLSALGITAVVPKVGGVEPPKPGLPSAIRCCLSTAWRWKTPIPCLPKSRAAQGKAFLCTSSGTVRRWILPSSRFMMKSLDATV